MHIIGLLEPAKSFRKISVPDAATLFDLLDFDASASHLNMGCARFELDLKVQEHYVDVIGRPSRRLIGMIWDVSLLG